MWRCQRAVDRVGLALQTLIVDAGAAPDPVGTAAAVEGCVDRSGNRGVADAHLSDSEAVGFAGDRLHAVGDGGSTHLVVHRDGAGDVAGRQFQRQLEDAQVQFVLSANLADRGAAFGEVGYHLRRHFARKGGDALVGDAVIAGKDRDHRVVKGRLGLALPARQPLDQLFHPAERARRLGQLRIVLPDRVDGLLIALGNEGNEVGDLGKRIGHVLQRLGGAVFLRRVFRSS